MNAHDSRRHNDVDREPSSPPETGWHHRQPGGTHHTTRLTRLVASALVAACTILIARATFARATGTEPADPPQSETAVRGIDLGDFQIRIYNPVESKKGALRFTLYASVKQEDARDFERLLEHRQRKVRDQVIVATRLVPFADFDDPELVSFRRRILLRLHRSIPELAVQDVLVSDFELSVDAI